MRSLLRWTSLVLAAAVLYPLGARGFHHRQFDLFLGIVLGLAALIVVVFLTTSTPDAER